MIKCRKTVLMLFMLCGWKAADEVGMKRNGYACSPPQLSPSRCAL